MTAVVELVPGDEVTLGPGTAVFVTATQHPIWPNLALVIWRMPEGSEEAWSHDALGWYQEVGQAAPSTAADRAARLRTALLSEGRR